MPEPADPNANALLRILLDAERDCLRLCVAKWMVENGSTGDIGELGKDKGESTHILVFVVSALGGELPLGLALLVRFWR